MILNKGQTVFPTSIFYPMGWTERISLILLGLSTLAAGLDKIIELCFADRIIDIILRRGKSFAAYKLGDQYQ